MRVALYARVSTLNGQHPEMQLSELRECRGQKLGRPKRIVDRDRVLHMKAKGMSLRNIADKLGVGYGTIRVRLAQVS